MWLMNVSVWTIGLIVADTRRLHPNLIQSIQECDLIYIETLNKIQRFMYPSFGLFLQLTKYFWKLSCNTPARSDSLNTQPNISVYAVID